MITRRSFVASVAGLAGAPALLRVGRVDADLVLRNGILHDGLGGPGREADVAITGDRVTAIGRRLGDRGRREIDLRGLALAPGFIDIHSHGDGSLRTDPRAESLVRQGITTIVVGQDGGSAAPVEAGDPPRVIGFAEHFRTLEALHPAVNVASMVGLGHLRRFVVGEANRPASEVELARMTQLVEQALAEGACGASTGLEYAPGAFATREELAALCRPLAARRLAYATHMRNEDDRLLESIDEAIWVAREAGCPLQISHLKTQGPRNWRKLDDAFARIEAAAAAGLDVAFDRYPYIAYQTGLSNMFPVWALDGGTSAFLARLDASDTASRIRAESVAKAELVGGWDNVQIADVRAPDDKAAEGTRLGARAASLGLDPYDYAVALLRRSDGRVGTVVFAMSEENLERILAHPRGMVCSDGGAFAVDGPARRGHPHPRGLGTYARVLGRYVRERKSLTLERAIQKMTSMPASRAGLRDRGIVRVGASADLVAFDPATVTDRATFAEPFQYPVGIEYVLVNGAVALERGQRAPAGTGKALRP